MAVEHKCEVARCKHPYPAMYKIMLLDEVFGRLCEHHGRIAKEFLEGNDAGKNQYQREGQK